MYVRKKKSDSRKPSTHRILTTKSANTVESNNRPEREFRHELFSINLSLYKLQLQFGLNKESKQTMTVDVETPSAFKGVTLKYAGKELEIKDEVSVFFAFG